VDYTILIVEPDLERGKEIVYLLMCSGYDALVAASADTALHQLYELHPDAVILSNQLPVVEIARLSEAISLMSDLPIVELADSLSLCRIAQRLTCSTEMSELVGTLDQLFRETEP
jgi:DNA-binding response OmpR family regulator